MAAYNEALLRPLVETTNSQQEIIRQQAEQVGRLSAELEQARRWIAASEASRESETVPVHPRE